MSSEKTPYSNETEPVVTATEQPMSEAEQAELAKMYKVDSPSDPEQAQEIITALSQTLERDQNILGMIQKIKRQINVSGAPELGSADFNDIVDSLSSAGHDNPESLAKKLLTGDTDYAIEDSYQREIAYRKELIAKNQSSI